MKMSRQNPGGEIHAKPTMKGCEKYMDKGKGDVFQSDYPSSTNPMRKQTVAAPGLSGMSKAGHVRSTHAHTSMSGSTVTGTSKACK